MEIFVEGVSRKNVAPDLVIANIFFNAKGKTSEEAIQRGVNNVSTFTNLVVLGVGLPIESLTTKNFSINEDRVYNEDARRHEVSGYVFNQFASIKMDYNNDLLSKFLTLVSSLENAPEINFQFGVKDEEKYTNELVNEAYNDAKRKAEMLARASNKTLGDSLMLELKGNTQGQLFRSQSNFDGGLLKTMSINNIDTSSIVPEDIEIEVVVNSKWNAN